MAYNSFVSSLNLLDAIRKPCTSQSVLHVQHVIEHAISYPLFCSCDNLPNAENRPRRCLRAITPRGARKSSA